MTYIALSHKELAYLKAGDMTERGNESCFLHSPGWDDKTQIVRFAVHKWDNERGLELHIYLPNSTLITASVTRIETSKKRPQSLEVR
jgi:hypothetical protein